MSKALANRVKEAVFRDNTIVCSMDTIQDSPGFSTRHMQFLGLSKSDLKKLEHKGFARRGYSKNMWLPGETTPNGSVVPAGCTERGRGMSVRWILVGDYNG